MLQRIVVCAVVLLLASVCAMADEGVEPAKPDGSPVFVFVEPSPEMPTPKKGTDAALIAAFAGVDPEFAERDLVNAMTRVRRVGAPLGGLKPIVGKVKRQAQSQAQDAGAVVFLHVVILSRHIKQGTYELSVEYTVYNPEGDSWKRCCSGTLTALGWPDRGMRETGVTDCDHIATQLGMLLIARVLPYKVTRVTSKAAYVTVTNSTPHTIHEMKIEVPRGEDIVHGRSTDVLKPGEQTDIAFELSWKSRSRWELTMPARRPMISHVDFDRTSEGNGARNEGRRRAVPSFGRPQDER